MKSESIFKRAQEVIPGGVNSPVRAFQAVGASPRFIDSAKGSKITDVDGKTYIDYIGSWGPMILGHSAPCIIEAVSQRMAKGLSFGAATELEVEMAELITKIVPGIDMLRMVNSGTEAVMSALRLARGYTGRDKIIKFAGCYHGHSDSMLVKAGSGALTFGISGSSGVTAGCAKDTLIADYNDLESVKILFEHNKGQIAAIIVEPVAANMGLVLPLDGFLQGLRKICDEEGALLIFDEVITGFRLALGGAQEYFGILADIVVFGKIIGGGLPVGAYGAKREIMHCVSPIGNVYQAGTLSGNPLAMSAGLATLTELAQKPNLYKDLDNKGKQFADGLRRITQNTVTQLGSLVCLFMTEDPVFDFNSAMKSDTSKYAVMFRALLDKGVYIAPAQFEALFLSNAHTDEDISITLDCFEQSLGGIVR